MRKKRLEVQGFVIQIHSINDSDFVSLTDIAKNASDEKPAYSIQNWIRNNNTIRYLTRWEQVHNPNLKVVQMHDLLEKFTNNRTAVSAQKWIEETGAIGVIQKVGRGGGTFAHSDIALNFMYWLSPEFQIYFLKEFQRLKKDEALQLGEQWSVRREISKANHPIFTEAVKTTLIPAKLPKNKTGIVYASETDILNMAVFRMTAKQWKIQNPKAKGNIRDHASMVDLLILSNLQVLDASLIKWNSDQQQRIEILSEKAEEQRRILSKSKAVKRLDEK